MTADVWREIERLFHAARAVSHAEREGWLARQCGNDQVLFGEVASLLAAEPFGECLAHAPAKLAADLLNGEEGALASGDTVSGYLIDTPVSSGGMGDVYLAIDRQTGRRVALKVLRRGLALDATAVERFAIEARACAALRHPNIVAIYDSGDSEAGQFIAMEWVEGRTWRDLIDSGNTGSPIAARLGAQAADALEAAHGEGILHRDVKPENLMVCGAEVVKVLDFGLARVPARPFVDPEAFGSAGTISGTLSGTLRYMAPELLRGEAASTASDVFSLGVVLYELATGCHPFAGDTPLDVFEAIECGSPASASSVCSDVPPELDRLLMRMLDRRSSARPDAAETASVLREIAGRLPTSASATP